MHNQSKWGWTSWLGAGLCFFLMACSHSPERYHPRYAEFAPTIATVLLLMPEVNVYEELADGRLAWHAAGSAAARQHVRQAVHSTLAGKHLVIHCATPERMAEADARDVQALFRAVNRAIQLHTYGPQLFPAKLRSFEYHVGAVESLLDASGADALVLAVGHQVVSTRRPHAWISIALVEPQGRIVWYSMQGTEADPGLQSAKETQTLVNTTLQHFPGGSS